MKKFLFIIGGLLFFVSGKSQEMWTLEACVNYALENNIQLKSTKLEAQIADQDLLQAKGGVLPDLNAFGNHVYNFGQRVDPFTNEFAETRVQSNNFNISSNLTLFSGLQNYNAIKQAQFNRVASEYDVENQEYNISLQV